LSLITNNGLISVNFPGEKPKNVRHEEVLLTLKVYHVMRNKRTCFTDGPLHSFLKSWLLPVAVFGTLVTGCNNTNKEASNTSAATDTTIASFDTAFKVEAESFADLQVLRYQVPSYYKGNIPWIKTGEVTNEIIFDTEEKITKEAIANSSAKLYPRGSLVIAMYGQGQTRGRTAKLGIDASTNQACAVLTEIKNKVILTDYLWIYLMGEYSRLRSLASGNNQPNLNAQMIKSYPVIIPSKELQQQIIDRFNDYREKKANLKKNAELLINQAQQEFEKAIFS